MADSVFLGEASGGGTPADPDTSVQFNDSGSFGGNAAFTYDVTNHAVKVNNDFYAALTSTYKYGLNIGANDSSGYGARITMQSDSNDANNPDFETFSSQGTMASPESSSSGEILFSRGHSGYDGSDFVVAAFETVVVSGSVSAGMVPGKVIYGVQKPGSGTASMTIDGNIPSAAFNVPVVASSFIPSGQTASPITISGGDDGFDDSALIFDNATDNYIALVFNQPTNLAAIGDFKMRSADPDNNMTDFTSVNAGSAALTLFTDDLPLAIILGTGALNINGTPGVTGDATGTDVLHFVKGIYVGKN